MCEFRFAPSSSEESAMAKQPSRLGSFVEPRKEAKCSSQARRPGPCGSGLCKHGGSALRNRNKIVLLLPGAKLPFNPKRSNGPTARRDGIRCARGACQRARSLHSAAQGGVSAVDPAFARAGEHKQLDDGIRRGELGAYHRSRPVEAVGAGRNARQTGACRSSQAGRARKHGVTEGFSQISMSNGMHYNWIVDCDGVIPIIGNRQDRDAREGDVS